MRFFVQYYDLLDKAFELLNLPRSIARMAVIEELHVCEPGSESLPSSFSKTAYRDSFDSGGRWALKVANLPHYLRSHGRAEVVVAFDDGDRYPAVALDLRGETEDGEFEIYVVFTDCLGESRARSLALAAGSPQRFPGSCWTSGLPREPVGMTYTLDEITSVHDEDRGYCVYEREPDAVPGT
jgi:hypothetical protein